MRRKELPVFPAAQDDELKQEVPICTFKLVFLFIEEDFQLALPDVPRQVGFPTRLTGCSNSSCDSEPQIDTTCVPGRRFPGLAYTTNTDYLWAPERGVMTPCFVNQPLER